MSEPFDVYSDSTGISIGDWGTSLRLYVLDPGRSDEEVPEQRELGTVRMSNEHLKVFIYLVRRGILRHEAQAQFQFEVPKRTLAAFDIAEEEWREFWAPIGG